MKIKLITIGEPKGDYKNIFNEFAKRIGRFATLELHHIKENKDAEKKVLKVAEKSFVILFDEIGKELTSQDFSNFLQQKEVGGVSEISFLIGGTDGHTGAVREIGNYSLALSRLTLPHDLAMVVAIEAIYRALTIGAGHPYHRD